MEGFLVSAVIALLLILLGQVASSNIPEKPEELTWEDLEGDYSPKAIHLLSVSKPSPLIESVIKEARTKKYGAAILYVRELAPALNVLAERIAAPYFFVRASFITDSIKGEGFETESK